VVLLRFERIFDQLLFKTEWWDLTVRTSWTLMSSVLIHLFVFAELMGIHSGHQLTSPTGRETSQVTEVSFYEPRTVATKPIARAKRLTDETISSTTKSPEQHDSRPSADAPHAQENAPSAGRESGDNSPLAHYLFGLRQRIDQRKIYPSLSRRIGETGRVLISLKLLRDGTIHSIQIKSASRFARLDRAALDTVSLVNRYDPIPDAIAENQLTVDIPIEFAL